MGRRSVTGGVSESRGKVRLDFWWKGERLRPVLDLAWNERNARAGRRLIEDIKAKIRTGTFDPAEHFPEYARGAQLAPEREPAPTFKVMAGKWLASLASDKADSTRTSYERTLERYWYEPLGDKPIDQIRYLDITDALAEHEFATAKTRNNTLIPLRQTLQFAVDAEVIDENPASKIKNSKVQREPPDPLELDEVNAVLADIATHQHPQTLNYFETAIFAGMRVSEQIAVCWPDFDARRGLLRVHRARVWAKDKAKTKTSIGRDIELVDRAREAILRQRQYTALANKAIFQNPNTGRAWNDEQEQRKIWNATLKRLGIRHRPMMQTRHTFATLCLTAQANPAWVARQMGHVSTKMFFEVYSRWIEGADKGLERARVEKMINQAKLAATGTERK